MEPTKQIDVMVADASHEVYVISSLIFIIGSIVVTSINILSTLVDIGS